MSELSDRVFKGVGVHVKLFDDDDFMIIRETLSRIGVSPRGKNRLFQSCHVLKKNDVVIIAHFKELFALDGLPTTTTKEDLERRNAIIDLLEEWELLEVIDEDKIDDCMELSGIRIIKFSDKHNWELVPKFNTNSLRDFFDS